MVLPSTPVTKKSYRTRRKAAKRDAGQNEPSGDESDLSSLQSSPKKQVSPLKGSGTKPKRVDVFLPPPSPKRSRFAAVGESDAESSPKPVSMTLRIPVRANKGNTPKAAPTTPSPNLLTKASLNALDKSKRAASPEDTADDNESAAGSTPGTNRRTEEQRIQYLREQPDCGELEPHRAFCKRCKRWVGMGGKPNYPVYKWTRHIEKCKTKEPAESIGDSGDDQGSVAAPPERTPRRNEEQRRDFFFSDPRALVVREWEVQCRGCQKWIKLGKQRKWDLTPWSQHCNRCPGELSSGRVAILSRKLQLANDPQVKNFTTDAVVCDACNLPVVLQGDGDYNLAAWQDHKSTCVPTPVPIPPTTSNVDVPKPPTSNTVPKPPASNADTEVTLVGQSSSPPRVKKRPREDGDSAIEPAGAVTEELDARPAVKRRTESYEPPAGFLPSLWKWASTEVRAFVRAAFGGGAEVKEEVMEEAGEGSTTTTKA